MVSDPAAILNVPVMIEFHDRFRTWSRPFKGVARTAAGELITVCVKPDRKFWPDPREHLFMDWAGTALAKLLSLPGPRMFIVRVDESFIRANYLELSDVKPGYAVATEWVPQAFQSGRLSPDPAAIKNPGVVAGMVVLDTLVQNRDRTDDVLVVPDGTAGGARFRLALIDNAGPVWFPLLVPTKAALPDSSFLRAVLRRAPDVDGYIFAALTLRFDSLRSEVEQLPAVLRHEGSPDAEEFVLTVRTRTDDLQTVIPPAVTPYAGG